MQTANNGCRWILSTCKPGEPARYCCRPTQSKMVADDDGNKTKQWETFCPMHSLQHERNMQKESEEA